MNKKILLLLVALFTFATNSNAQVISMIGDAVSGWSTDVDMTTTDNVHYTLSNFTFTQGGAKFRQAHSWSNNWGASNFPSGTATSNGNNISVTAGVYDVSFNLTTKAYTFTPVAQGFASISVYGTSNGSVDGAMNTVDGINYVLNDYNLDLGNLVFRQDNDNTNTWGDAAFPSGTATAGGTAISVIPGTYNIKFNLTTGVYSFSFAVVSVIGDAKGGWGTDTDMTTTDGENYILNRTAFTNGSLKFRKDHAWATSWGNAAFPNGTATVNGNNINVTAGNYVVSFNRITGVYTFSSNYPAISLTSNGVDNDLVTTDGTNYYKYAVNVAAGNYQFRQAHANDFVWGADTFPSGTSATYITTSIPVAAGTYNIAFNKTTGAYSFSYVVISIIGDATPGNWSTDTDMTTTDGVNYKLMGVTLSGNGLKFRRAHDWGTNWGSNAFPSGTATNGGSNIAVGYGSIFNIYFNTETGAFSIVDTLLAKVRTDYCGATLAAINSQIPVTFISSASSYKYEVSNSGNVRTYETSKNNFDLLKLSGQTTYGTTYSVRVAVKLNGSSSYNPYGDACNVSTPILSSSAIPVTQVNDSFCGVTLPLLASKIPARLVTDAQSYRFEVTSGGITTIYDSANYNFRLSDISGGATYGTSYSIRVAANVNGVYGQFGYSCIVNTPALTSAIIPSTKVLAAFCGTTLPQLATKIGAEIVTNATGYRFEVTAGGSTTTYDSSAYNFRLTDINGGVAYGTTYTIRVAALINGVYGNYGTSCDVSTPALTAGAIPTTKIQDTFCGTTLASNTTKIAAQVITTASGYRFEITSNGTTTVYNSSTYNFRLADSGVTVTAGTVYSIRVAALVNGVYGNYGASCDVTTPAAGGFAKMIVNNDGEFSAVAYPNPFDNTFALKVNGSQESINITVYDMMGKLVETRIVNASVIESLSLGQNYSTGIYNVLVAQGENTKAIRLVRK